MSQCTETWGDEVGCDRPGLHRCEKVEAHLHHRCGCGAMVFADRPDLNGLLALAWTKSRWA